jgi:predicted nucleic acid-binding protein
MQVVADTSVCNSLLLLGQLSLLPTLYGRIITPPVVWEVELPHPRSPAPVRAWAQQLAGRPAWLALCAPTRAPEADVLLLEAGERDTILVAQELQADLVLMDDKDGRKAAELRALTVYGTLGC